MKNFFFPYDLKIKTPRYFHFYTLGLFLIVLLCFKFSTWLPELDTLINEKISLFHSPIKTDIFTFLTKIFDPKIFIGWFAIFCLILFGLKKRTEVFFLEFAVTFGVLIKVILKEIIQRPRPFDQLLENTSSSFPSGHSTTAALFFLALYFCFASTIKSPLLKNLFLGFCILSMFTIAFSRVYLHMHFLSDVVAGLLLGVSVVSFGRWVLNQLTKARAL